MIFALFALAAVMIVGGIASVVQGFPYVRLESGWTMTIAGAATASSGTVLLGLAVVATHLKRLQRVLAEQGAGFRAEVDDALSEVTGRIEPTGLTSGRVEEEPAPAGRRRPSLVAFNEPAGTSPSRFSEDIAPALPLGSDPALPGLPDLLPDPPPPPVDEPAPVPARAVEPEAAPPRRIKPNKPPRVVRPTPMVDTVIPAPETAAMAAETAPAVPALPPSRPREIDQEEPLGLRSSLVDAPDPAPTPAEQASIDEPAPAAAELGKDGLAVVGTYASGGNTYVMYANGSIEADTPRGQFTFDSLDELKAFVEAGGEDGTRGAA